MSRLRGHWLAALFTVAGAWLAAGLALELATRALSPRALAATAVISFCSGVIIGWAVACGAAIWCKRGKTGGRK